MYYHEENSIKKMLNNVVKELLSNSNSQKGKMPEVQFNDRWMISA